MCLSVRDLTCVTLSYMFPGLGLGVRFTDWLSKTSSSCKFMLGHLILICEFNKYNVMYDRLKIISFFVAGPFRILRYSVFQLLLTTKFCVSFAVHVISFFVTFRNCKIIVSTPDFVCGDISL